MKESTAIQPNPFLDSAQVMKFLRISRMTLNRLKGKGELQAYKLGGKLFFKRDEILARIEAGKEETPETKTISLNAQTNKPVRA